MQKAKQAATSFLSKDGKHNTTVDQDVRGAVTEEHVRPHEHEIVTSAVDREVHQDHHQTRVQPVNAQETLPERSSHILSPVQHTEYEHGNDAELRSKLEQDAARYKSTSVTHETTHSTETAPMVSGEHIHHHVHEHIQPVIHKETISPHVVHRTIPIHETHHAAPIHHEATTLPVQTLQEWNTAHGDSLKPETTTTLREFEGCPGPYNKERKLPSTALHPDATDYHHTEGLNKSSSVGKTGNFGRTTSTNMSDGLNKTDGLSKSDDLGKAGTGGLSKTDDFSKNTMDALDKTTGMGNSDKMGKTRDFSEPLTEEGNYTTYSDKVKAGGSGVAGAGGAVAAASAAGSKAGLHPSGAGDTADAATPRSEGRLSSSSSGSGSRRRSIMDKLNPLKESNNKVNTPTR